MLQEFFMGAVAGPAKKAGTKGKSKEPDVTGTVPAVETSFTAAEPSTFLDSRVIMGKFLQFQWI